MNEVIKRVERDISNDWSVEAKDILSLINYIKLMRVALIGITALFTIAIFAIITIG